MDSVAAAVYMLVLSLLVVWAAFWVIRLGVRYGVDDALRKHRALTRPPSTDERVG